MLAVGLGWGVGEGWSLPNKGRPSSLGMRVAVVGVGGVGGVLAGALESAGRAQMTLVSRGPALEALRRNGLVVRTFEGDVHHFPLERDQVLSVDQAATQGEPQDVVFVTTKVCPSRGVGGGLGSGLRLGFAWVGQAAWWA